jgi:hypothetical protein
MSRSGLNQAADTLLLTGAGSFMGELAQLGGRPSLIDAHAQDEVEACSPEI